MLWQSRFHPALVEHDVFLNDIDPRHDGLRVAQISDVHVGRLTPRAHVRRAVELANEARPDIIVMTGDYVCWRADEIPLMQDQLSGLQAERVLVTLGNHDYVASGDLVTAAMTRNGYDVLKNQHTTTWIRGAPLHIVGLDDPVTRRHDIGKAFAALPQNGTRLVLSHCPEQADVLAARGAHLILSGHTHGGQIFIRGFTDRWLRRLGWRYLSGFYEIDRSLLYVTAGIGYTGIRMRAGHGTRAEVVIHTLRYRRPAA